MVSKLPGPVLTTVPMLFLTKLSFVLLILYPSGVTHESLVIPPLLLPSHHSILANLDLPEAGNPMAHGQAPTHCHCDCPGALLQPHQSFLRNALAPFALGSTLSGTDDAQGPNIKKVVCL